MVTLSWVVFKDGAAGIYATGSGSTLKFTPNDNGTYRVVLFAFDEDDGGSTTTDQVVTVANAAPVPSMDLISFPWVEGTSIRVAGSATDPAGAGDAVSLTWTVYREGPLRDRWWCELHVHPGSTATTASC